MNYLPIPTIPAFPLLRQRHLVLNKIKVKGTEFLLETQICIIHISLQPDSVYFEYLKIDLLIKHSS